MRVTRHGALLAGVSLFVGGLVVLFDGGAPLSIEPLVDIFGDDYLLVGAIGSLALVGGVFLLGLRARTGFEQATPPAPTVATRPAPGVEIDRVIEDGLDLSAHFSRTERSAIKGRLREAAIDTVMRTEGCSSATASERIADGRWTDDEAVATFLAEDGSVTVLDRLRDVVGSGFRRRTRRTVEAIVDRDDTLEET